MTILAEALAIAAAVREQAHIDRRAYQCVVIPAIVKTGRTWRDTRRRRK